MTERSAFAGGDQAYLRDRQYGTGANLDARARLHRTYATAQEPLSTFAAALVDWSPTARVLECGCGTGRFWENTTTPRSLDLVLTDLSPGMVDEAVERARDEGFEHVAGKALDVQDLPFDDASFDVVLANHMLYHVPDPDRAVAELARVVRPDGVVLAATNGYGHMGEINEVTAAVLGEHAEALYEVFGIDTGERRLRERFASVVWHAYDNDLIVDDPAAVLAYATSYPPGEDADAEQVAELDRVIRSRFVDGTMRIRTRAGVFVARSPRATGQ